MACPSGEEPGGGRGSQSDRARLLWESRGSWELEGHARGGGGGEEQLRLRCGIRLSQAGGEMSRACGTRKQLPDAGGSSTCANGLSLEQPSEVGTAIVG